MLNITLGFEQFLSILISKMSEIKTFSREKECFFVVVVIKNKGAHHHH